MSLIGDAEQHRFGEADQQQPVDGAAHRRRGDPQEPLGRWAQQAMADGFGLLQQRVALAKHEEHDQQREEQRRDASRRLSADDPAPFRQRGSVDPGERALLAAQARVQPVGHRRADQRQVRDPLRRRDFMPAEFRNPPHHRAVFPPGLDDGEPQRRQDHHEDEYRHRHGGPVAPDACARGHEHRPRGDGEDDRPGERGQERREHPHRERQQAERCGDARNAPADFRAVRHRSVGGAGLGHCKGSNAQAGPTHAARH